MAMHNPILFTGRELNFEIPDSKQLNAASERLNAKLEKREDMQRKLQDEMRKGMRIDFHVFVADFARKQQFEAITDFENKWTARTRERGNKLTNEDLIEMENDKAAIGRLQNDWLTSQQLWERDDNLVQKSPGDFDVSKHVAATEEFLTTGVYKPGALEFSGIDMANFFSEEKWEGANPTAIEDVTPGSAFNTFTKTYTNSTEEEAKQHIVHTLFSDKTGRALKGVIQDFAQESPETKLRYLGKYDKNGDKVISDEELASATGNVKVGGRNMLDNPIIQYAQDKYLPRVRRTKVTTDKQRAIHTGGSGGTKEPAVTFTENITLPGGGKATKTYKGTEAQVKIAEAEAKKATVAQDVEQIPWGGEDEKYEIPKKTSDVTPVKKGMYSGYKFEVGGPRQWGFETNPKKVAKEDLAVFNLYDPDKKAFLFSSKGKTRAYTAAELPQKVKDALYSLKVNTGSAIMTLGELVSGVTKAQTTPSEAELDNL